MSRPAASVCLSCTRRAALACEIIYRNQKRSISQGYLRKAAQAEQEWQAQAIRILDGKKKSMLAILEERGFVDAIVGDRDALDRQMTKKRIGAYVGVDPTAPSLHVGHLLPLMVLFWLYVHGYSTVSLIGAYTARVGDPTGRLTSRDELKSEDRKSNMISMHYQTKLLWQRVELHAQKYGYKYEWSWRRALVSNNTWLNKLPITEFLNVLGSGVRIGTMLGRETVRQKMEKGDGMSFAEFTYPLLQAWDWWYLYSTKGIQLQIGGSDQYGNLVAGVDIVKHIIKSHHDPRMRQEKEDPLNVPYGLTVPLLTTTSGQKFGKSEGNAVWLDKEMTSVFDLYQFFLRSADSDVVRYLKLFTFLPLAQIDSIMQGHNRDPSKRQAQHILARECVALIHGLGPAQEAELQHRSIFQRSGDASTDGSEFESPNKHFTPRKMETLVNLTLPRSLVIDKSPARVLYSAGLVQSRSEGQRLIQDRGAYIGAKPGQTKKMGDTLAFTPLELWEGGMLKKFIMEGNILVLRAGKFKVKIIRIIEDAEFERRGLNAPGWEDEKARQKGLPVKEDDGDDGPFAGHA